MNIPTSADNNKNNNRHRRSATNTNKINTNSFYGEYNGHKVKHLKTLYPLLRSSSDALIWTAGDSSLDNKYWFADRKPAVGEYANILQPPSSVCDVTYWLNYTNQEKEQHLPTINTAVEATTLNERTLRLRSQDHFICDNIGPEDILIVSVGGNDVALLPTPCTIAYVFCFALCCSFQMVCVRTSLSSWCCTSCSC